MNRSKKKAVHPTDDMPKEKYDFSKVFKVKFDALVKAYSDSLESLNKMSSGKISCDYGVCATTYHNRYITPKDISTFVDNLCRAIEAGFFHDNINDLNTFLVASVKKAFEDNGSETLDDDLALDESGKYVNPKEQTLQDLEMVCANDFGPIAVYSKGEMVQRIKLMSEDLKKINDMHYAANAKKLVNALPKIISDNCVYSMAIMKAIVKTIEDFLLFATTVNTCTVLQMYAYCNPATDYSFKKVKKEDSEKEDVVTECCMCKTNDYMIRNRIPFNCNMRDVVLQDVTPDFKDTHDALHFIMKDARSPIAILVRKYAPKDAGKNFHGGDAIARMFLGVDRCHERCLNDVFKKDGRDVIGDPLDDVADFQTHVDWLDTIAFGNNYLDGNYRRDAMGNNHVHPITNSLDMIFKMYSGCDLKANDEIAENIICIAGAIKGIIQAYRSGAPIENYDLTKDVLVLLGEILTRNILKLYYNNTQVIRITDDMTNAAAPGFIGESFIMEDGEVKTDQTGNSQGSKGEEKPYNGVTFKDGNGNEIKPVNTDGIKKLMAKIADWFKRVFNNFGKESREKLNKYIDFVKKNDAINLEIASKLGRDFHAHLKDFKKWSIKGDRLNGGDDIASGVVDAVLAEGANISFEQQVLMMLGIPKEKYDTIITSENSGGADKTNWKDITNRVISYYYFESTDPAQQTINDEMTADIWKNDVVGMITGSADAIDAAVAAFNKKGETVKSKIDAKLNEQGLKDLQKKKLDELSKAYQKAFTELARSITTYILNPIIKDRYALYTTVVQNYKNQKSTGGITNTPEGGNNNAQTNQ